jgi:hypothetical protein
MEREEQERYRKRQVTLIRYENISSGNIFFGFKKKDALLKEIDGETYMEVTPSTIRPKPHWVRIDNLREIGLITFDKP